MPEPTANFFKKLLFAARLLKYGVLGLVISIAGFFVLYFLPSSRPESTPQLSAAVPATLIKRPDPVADSMWQAPSIKALSQDATGKQIRYGRDLIAHTAKYLGPKGSVAQISNGMNCQNCHLDAGTKAFGNNYSQVAATYPKFRGRSGTIEGIEKRINDCLERSLNGQALDSQSTEMKAMVAYIKWVGKEVKKGDKPKGSGFIKMALLDRPANPENGRKLYLVKCQVCHNENGEGKKPDAGAPEYQYPPLWGKHSYNVGAGLYRVSNFAGFIKANMPLGATYDKAVLTEEEAWDIAAFVNSAPRPARDLSRDWPDISLKPFDHPFGPYADTFSPLQHKFGPFQPIKDFYDREKRK